MLNQSGLYWLLWFLQKSTEQNDASVLLIWQGRQDSNLQPTVLETVALPLSHSPKRENNIIIAVVLCQAGEVLLNDLHAASF